MEFVADNPTKNDCEQKLVGTSMVHIHGEYEKVKSTVPSWFISSDADGPRSPGIQKLGPGVYTIVLCAHANRALRMIRVVSKYVFITLHIIHHNAGRLLIL